MTFEVTSRPASVARYFARFARRPRSTMSASAQAAAESSRTSRAEWSRAASSPMWRWTVGSWDGDIVGPHDTLARVFDGEGQRRLGDPHIDRRVAEPEALDHADLDRRAGPAERRVVGDAHALEGHGGAERGAHAERVPLAVGHEAGRLRGHERLEQGFAHVGLTVARAPDHVVGGAERHRAEVLHAIDHPVVTVPSDRGLHDAGAREAHRAL